MLHVRNHHLQFVHSFENLDLVGLDKLLFKNESTLIFFNIDTMYLYIIIVYMKRIKLKYMYITYSNCYQPQHSED